MAAVPKNKAKPKWVIDLHGIREALTTRSNASKTRVIEAIESGEMLIMRSVSDELRAAFPGLWADFNAIKPKKYFTSTMAVYAAAGTLQAAHGTTLLGGMPDFAHFEAVAAARNLKCKLVSGGKALGHCNDIAIKCGIPVGDVTGIAAV